MSDQGASKGRRPRFGGRVALAVLLSCVTCSVYDQALLSGTGAVASSGTGGAGGSDGGTGPNAPPQGGKAGSSGSSPGGAAGAGGDPGATGAAGEGGTSAGTGGAGGDPGGEGGAGAVLELIDDMEDDDRFVIATSGRNGYWQTHNDATEGSTQAPPPGAGFTMTELTGDTARPGSQYAAGMHVSGFVTSAWGALMVASMRADGASIDASAFCGLHFWARRTGSAELVLRVVDKHSSPAGGLCIDDEAAGDQRCNDDFHTTLSVATEWSDYMVRFADLVQWGFGYASPTGTIDASAIHGIVFSIDEAADYEVLVDDLALVRAGHCG